MSDRPAYRRSLGLVLAAGLTVRIVIAFTATQAPDNQDDPDPDGPRVAAHIAQPS